MRFRDPRQFKSGFTLIELLVVIAIIALLAGLIVNLAPGADRKKKEELVKVQLGALETMLERYRAKHGFYPPSNVNDPSRHSLYYELTGTLDGPSGGFVDVDGDEVTAPELLAGCGIEGLINVGRGPSRRSVKNFFPNIRDNQVAEDPDAPGVKYLVVPVEGPVKGQRFNPWNYNTMSPTNNPQSYDLWAEIFVGDETITIGNW